MKHCYEVCANVELDLEKIVEAVKREEGNDITADDVFEYITDHLSFLAPRNNAVGIYSASDGPSINGYADSKTYYEIEALINPEPDDESDEPETKEGVKNYRVQYIDGFDLKYKVYETYAKDADEAVSLLYKFHAPVDFDHQILEVTEIGWEENET